MTTFVEALSSMPLIAILRGIAPGEVEAVGEALVVAGVPIVEIPLNSPDPFASIERLEATIGKRAVVGAGTVMTPEDVGRVRDAGATLVVTPHADPAVVQRAKALDLSCVPGFATPTEAFRMIEAGADALKLFPAEGASPAVLKAIRAVLPKGQFVLPVGGIGSDNVAAWWRAGAAGFGIGSYLYRPGDPPEAVGKRAQSLVAAMRRVMGATGTRRKA